MKIFDEREKFQERSMDEDKESAEASSHGNGNEEEAHESGKSSGESENEEEDSEAMKKLLEGTFEEATVVEEARKQLLMKRSANDHVDISGMTDTDRNDMRKIAGKFLFFIIVHGHIVD